MAIEKDELQEIENAVQGIWGDRSNLFLMGSSLREIKYLDVPRYFDTFSEQLELYFDWFLETQDRRTRRIVKSHPIEYMRTIETDNKSYKKLLKAYKEGTIQAERNKLPTLAFKDLRSAQKVYSDLVMKAVDMIAAGVSELDLYNEFVTNGDERHQEFAKTYGKITYKKYLQIKVNGWKDHFWTYDWAIANGGKLTDGRETQYLGCNPVFVIGEDKRRLQERVTELHMLYTELDYYKLDEFKGMSQDEMEKLILERLDEYAFPHPTEILRSRGLQLIWRTNPIGQIRHTYWCFLQKYIYEMLKEYGADGAVVTDSARVLRAVGSIHKSTQKVITGKTYVEVGERLKFDELLECFVWDQVLTHQKTLEEKRRKGREKYERYLRYLEHKRQEDQKKNARKKAFTALDGGKKESPEEDNSAIIKDPWNLRHQRIIHDIFALSEHRKGRMNGCREVACFLVRYYTLCTTAGNKIKALNEMEKLYNSFDDFYDKDAVVYLWDTLCDLTKSAERGYENWVSGEYDHLGRRKGYNYSKERLREVLQVTKEEDSILVALISDEEAERRAKERDLKKKTKKNRAKGMKPKEEYLGAFHKVKEQGIELKDQGFKYKEIAEQLNVSINTVKGWFRKTKKSV
ncbi:hypothetical protein [Priestia sp. TSO9]|uniref:hypothetical protein n=1 Tax=Priestia sp. TSO9 TaxID=2885632 RepID=UPI001E61D930|nr:hypothetical protein [Priestia sp. TSO9]